MEDEENRPWLCASRLISRNVVLDCLQEGRQHGGPIRVRGADRLDRQALVLTKLFEDFLDVHGRCSANHLRGGIIGRRRGLVARTRTYAEELRTYSQVC